MNNNYVVPEGWKYTISIPKYSKWRCEVTSGFVLCPLEGKEPSWFWRKMQGLVLGFKWSKNDKV